MRGARASGRIGLCLDMLGSLSSLLTLLDTNSLAKRLDPSEQVWKVSSQWWRGDAPDRLLEQVLSLLLAAGQPCLLGLNGAIDWKDLGGKPWRSATAGLWRIPANLDPGSFIASSVHNEGNYALYVCESEANIERILEGLPWWGWSQARDRASRIVQGLRQAEVEAALVVHPDASAWMLAIPEVRRIGSS